MTPKGSAGASGGSDGADPPVLSTLDDGVLTLTLNRPDKRNALNQATVAALIDALTGAAADASVRVIVLRGAGPDFCAGADLEAMERISAESDPVANLADAQGLGALLVLMRRHSKPIIAAVHGHALAGGAGLATACDLVLAREDAVFGYPEVHLGFVPAMVMALLRRAVGEKVAFELTVRGQRFGAEEAAGLGLINRVIPEPIWDEGVAEFAHSLADQSKTAVSLIKRLLYGMDGLSFEEAVARGAEVNALARLTPDTREGVRRFLEKRTE
ncbi:MAG: enoyl-CoA hydratase/isomerase family protein [Gemmatimonadetes bacterium]|nr:enoyl-CoA hydratase/isomerase family protein [Gemmatimonadota bacterium]NIQ59327.1 enoyl-CoA hydratase/isomerase family protein [Gemmatimonadota bacterium]NIU79515.1 enoyl-CoA hydratase/isomerase family protein [Gammaproteobacteria bacterium]NIX48149.1 enoyl-CoA hydratase/isomerase family protein [Gemmatimonadota bacterium]NIY12541.1 enoyl-CoA hydratase/isomerase family protein [Gemmatimonadota bacterium]